MSSYQKSVGDRNVEIVAMDSHTKEDERSQKKRSKDAFHVKEAFVKILFLDNESQVGVDIGGILEKLVIFR